MNYLSEGGHSTGLRETNSEDLVVRRLHQGVRPPVLLQDLDVLTLRPGHEVAGAHVALVVQGGDGPHQLQVPDGLRVGPDEVGHDLPAGDSLAADLAVG